MVRKKLPSSYFSFSERSQEKDRRDEAQGGMEGVSLKAASEITYKDKDDMDGDSEEDEGGEEHAVLEDKEVAISHEETGSSVANFSPLVEEDDGTKIEKLALAMKEGRTVMCLYNDGFHHPAKVLEIKERPAGFLKYYVHYLDMDRRNDKWVEHTQLNPDFVGPVLDFRNKTLTGSAVLTRRQKQKMGIEEEHEELDREAVREHEELTKIKSISFIQMGGEKIETWYYSPLPPEFDECETIFFCEYCLTILKTEDQLKTHKQENCHSFCPPGNKIYTSESLAVFEFTRSQVARLAFIIKVENKTGS